jgi:superfamily I DNA/RNA helicase
VVHGPGPLIVVAGPGTGKTRVLTERIVHLVNHHLADGDKILAVTFTQKAAAEMQERLAGRLEPEKRTPLVTTFHGLCLQLLKERGAQERATDPADPAEKEGFIISGERQRALMADALEILPAAPKGASALKAKRALVGISAAKQGLLPPDAAPADLAAAADGLDIAAIYPIYQRLLENQGAWDYDDLIYQVVDRLERDGAYRSACRERFTHIFVDEYQDLNASQYRIVKALCPAGSQICVIGDPDQAIYGFRGARMAYFNNFLEDYPSARVVHLRRNYRSVQSVLSAAFDVIARQHVSLTGDGDDRPVAQVRDNQGDARHPQVFELSAATERSEAVAMGKIIQQLIGGTGFHHIDFGAVQDRAIARQRSFGDFAILYRTHQQGELLADQLGKGGIPCQLASRRHLLGHPAVAALIAVVQLMNNSALFSDFATAAGAFKAGIGPKTLRQFKSWSYHKGFRLGEALAAARRVPLPGISLARQQSIFDFIQRLESLRSHLDPLSLPDQLRHLIGQTPLGALFDDDEAATRAVSLLTQRAARLQSAGGKGMERGAFLESLSLLTDTDGYDPRAERVALMTLHAAKGLEFPVVFIAGCEDGFLPHRRLSAEAKRNAAATATATATASATASATDGVSDLAEERRLLYVGMTRARHQLFLSRSRKRRIFGKVQKREPSPFLADIDGNLLTPWDGKLAKKAPPRQKQLGLFD